MWKYPEFRRLWLGEASSYLGMSLILVVLPLTAIDLGATNFQIGLLASSAGAGWLLVALVAGAAVDRFSRGAMMLMCLAIRLVIVGILLVSLVADRITIVHLCTASLVLGIISVFFEVAGQTMIPSLLPTKFLVSANGAIFTANSIAVAVGPSLAALIITVVGSPGRALALDCAAVIIAMVALFGIRNYGAPPARGPEKRSLVREIGDGITFVVSQSTMRRTLSCGATSNFFTAMVTTVVPIFLVRDLGVGVAVVAVVVSLGATGGIAGGSLVGPLVARLGEARTMWLGKVFFGMFGLLIPIAVARFSVPMVATGLFGIHAAFAIYNVIQVSYRQAACPPEARGRVNATVRWVHRSTIPAGALLAGLLSDALGTRTTTAIGVCGAVAAVGWILGSPLRAISDSFESKSNASTVVAS